jgi:hypothetical protein
MIAGDELEHKPLTPRSNQSKSPSVIARRVLVLAKGKDSDNPLGHLTAPVDRYERSPR